MDKGYVNPDLLWSVEELSSAAEPVYIVDTRPVHEYVEVISRELSISMWSD